MTRRPPPSNTKFSIAMSSLPKYASVGPAQIRLEYPSRMDVDMVPDSMTSIMTPISSRALNNIAQEVGGYEVGYHGANQLNGTDAGTYSGAHRFWARRKGGKVRLLVRTITAGDGSERTMGGVRLPQLWGDAGYTDVSTDGKGGNITIFTVTKVGDNKAVEFLHSQNRAYDGKPSAYGEL